MEKKSTPSVFDEVSPPRVARASFFDHLQAHRTRWLGVFIVGILFCTGGAEYALGAQPPFKTVVVIEAERPGRPLFSAFNNSFQAALREAFDEPVEVFVESLDLARFGRDDYRQRLGIWLGEKYDGRRIDAVVALGPFGYRAAIGWRDRLWPEVPVIFAGLDQETIEEVGRSRHSTGLLNEFGHLDTIRMALDLFPETRNIAIVGGPHDQDVYSRYFFRQIDETFAEDFEIIDISGQAMPEMQQRVAQLPEHTIAFIASLLTDGAGRSFTTVEAISLLAPGANAPFFSFMKPHLGSGIVGGFLFDPERVGRQTAALVARILEGESPEAIDLQQVDFNVLAFDWRELTRWEIPVRALPEGSAVVFRPSTMWEDHWILILMVIAVILVQGLLIAALFRSIQRRRTMTRELHRLSGRLITAQEDERRRVARELHDDISQRLALLAIELDSTIQGVGFDDEPVSSKVHSLARDVHAIAHNLHPSRLGSLGLAPALSSFCEEIEQRHGVRVLFRGPEAPGKLPAEPALAIYRVAQEALQNAIRHSGASEISMTLTVKPSSACLTVSDDGIGIAENNSGQDHGLGIIGMRERVRLIGGTFDVKAGAGVGTVINIQVPIRNSREE